MKQMKILMVVTGTGMFPDGKQETGLWLSELTHIYDSAKNRGYDIVIASPKGGDTPVDPMSLKTMYMDKLSKSCWDDSEFRDVLRHTKSLDEVSGEMFDCIYLAGGHGAMFDFTDNAVLQELIKNHYESNKIVGAICHGVCGLLNVKLSDGQYLVKDKKVTGFSWFEEGLAGKKKEVPFDLESALKERRADYKKSLIPMMPEVVADGNLITGQDPFSSEKIAETVMGRFNQ